MMKVTVVHESAHIWDFMWPEKELASKMMEATGGYHTTETKLLINDEKCLEKLNNLICLRPFKVYNPGGHPATEYGGTAMTEDWAEAVAATVYPGHPRYIHDEYKTAWDWITGNGYKAPNMDTARANYVKKQFHSPLPYSGGH